MERTQLFDLMGEFKLYGMKAAYDEIMATAVKRQHEPQRTVGDLLNAEVSKKQAHSTKYQLTIAKLPLAKDLNDFHFEVFGRAGAINRGQFQSIDKQKFSPLTTEIGFSDVLVINEFAAATRQHD
jgi:hypothetical protein